MGDFTHIFECLIGTSVGTFVGTLLELQKKSNEETQYIVVKNSVHHKIL